jgi:hypothetical protein
MALAIFLLMVSESRVRLLGPLGGMFRFVAFINQMDMIETAVDFSPSYHFVQHVQHVQYGSLTVNGVNRPLIRLNFPSQTRNSTSVALGFGGAQGSGFVGSL